MAIDHRIPDGQYHHARAEQERRLARRARTREAAASHDELRRLHEIRRDAGTPPG